MNEIQYYAKPWSKKFRPCRMLADASDRVVSIRKTLRQVFGAASNRTSSGVRDDAVKTCDLIERLCRQGRNVSAEESIDYCDLVEICLDHLESQLMELIASRGKQLEG